MSNYEAELRDYLKKKENVVELIDKLDISDEDIETAAMEQPTLYLRAARFRVQKMRGRASAKIAYTTEKSKAKIRVRDKSKKKGGAKATESAIGDLANMDKLVQEAELAMENAERLEEFSKHLMTAYQQRLSIIKVIIDARWAEMGTVVKKAKEKEGKDQAKKLAEEVKERFRGSKHRRKFEEDDDI